MSKKLTERIAAQMQTKKPTRSGQNRAAFLALRSEITEALDDGWPVKTIWQTLRTEEKINFGYDAFINYVNTLIRNPKTIPVPTLVTPSAVSVEPASQKTKPTQNKPAPIKKPERERGAGFKFNPTPNPNELL